MLLVVLIGALVAMVSGQTTLVSQCTQNGGELPINVYIAGCSAPPCRLHQLEDAVINVTFKPPRDIKKMTTLATAYIILVNMIPISVPYPLEKNAETCNFLDNASCPVQEGEVVDYTLRFSIEPVYPVGVPVTVEFRIVDDTNIPFVCLRVPITIDHPRSK